MLNAYFGTDGALRDGDVVEVRSTPEDERGTPPSYAEALLAGPAEFRRPTETSEPRAPGEDAEGSRSFLHQCPFHGDSSGRRGLPPGGSTHLTELHPLVSCTPGCPHALSPGCAPCPAVRVDALLCPATAAATTVLTPSASASERSFVSAPEDRFPTLQPETSRPASTTTRHTSSTPAFSETVLPPSSPGSIRSPERRAALLRTLEQERLSLDALLRNLSLHQERHQAVLSRLVDYRIRISDLLIATAEDSLRSPTPSDAGGRE